ncbi:SDR family NAD(P)-dependent oxidoreductase [Aspergillus stella-maris]|uniref:SDR family NAD(P)-dependent oxidoreductase n=1 Tax=Aspergillus stella-maris TaxID=1810926 RepID=UPI003CCDF3AB
MTQAPSPNMPGVALITGAASGIGLACARVFIEEGVTRLILSDIYYEALSEAAQSLYAINPAIQTCLVNCDVSSEKQVEEMIVEGVKRFGAVHYCVNNAGITSRVRTKTHLLATEDWDDVVDVNLRGVWLCQRVELRQMMRQEKGAIVNISSVFGLITHPTVGAYSATKAGVLGITRTDAVAYAEDGIRVNSVLPGFVKTPPSIQRGANYEALIETIPIKRWGVPAEVAQAVVFLCSDRASMITCQQLAVSGGMEYSC